MKRYHYIKKLAIVPIIALLLASCSEDDEAPNLLVVDFTTVTDISFLSVNVEATVLTDGGAAITSKGFCYGTENNPTIEGPKVDIPAEQDFKATIDIESGTKYYVRAYAQNKNGITYSSSRIFKSPKPNLVVLSESFEDELPATWGNIDKDGDGFDWTFSPTFGYVYSKSFDVPSNSPLTPENYLISPELTIPDDAVSVELTFDVSARYPGYYREAYKVVASEQPIDMDNASSATTIKPYFTLTEDYVYPTFVNTKVDLTAYKGKKVYLGFVHGNCTNEDALILRNVVVRAIY